MSTRLAVLLLCTTGLIASAQSSPSTPSDSAPAPRRRSFASAINLKVIGGFAVATAAAFPLDEVIRDAAGRSAHSMGAMSSISNGANKLAMPGAYIAGYALYGAGMVSGKRPVADAGFHTLASVIVSTHITDLVKSAVGRSRPNATTAWNQFHWGAPHAKAGEYAFPSGHTAAAFAGATAISEELSASAPRAARYVNPLLYLAATSVGLARVQGQAHWASDVVAGAAVGTLTARAIVRGAHSHPKNLVDRVAVHAVIAVNEKGRVILGAAF